MIQATRKLIKVGSSWAVTLPADEVKRHHLVQGDELKVSADPVKKTDKHQKLLREYDAFVAEYGQTLKNLAKR